MRRARSSCSSKVRGKNRAIEELANLYAQFCNDPTQTIGLAHADCPADMLRLHSLLREKGHTGEILTVCYEPVTGSHVGPRRAGAVLHGRGVALNKEIKRLRPARRRCFRQRKRFRAGLFCANMTRDDKKF